MLPRCLAARHVPDRQGEVRRFFASLTATVLGLATLAPGASAQLTRADTAAFVRITQSLLDAITAGDSTVWGPHLSPSWFITDEEGRRQGRAVFLRELRPLPAGQAGKLVLGDRHLVGNGAVAVMSYDIDEEHDYYGQHLRSRFHATDTWVREGGVWRMLASQVTALPASVAGRPVSRRLREEYAGTYALTDDITLAIVPDDSGLRFIRRQRPAERLRALDDRIFVRNGARGFWAFERDSTGAVARLVQWRDNNAVRWRRRPATRR
jgi:hypothetical protein